jgi:hypothetical protein
MPPRRADPLIWTSTSVRLERTMLRGLKVAAVEADTTVNNLILDGIRHVLALHQKRMARVAAKATKIRPDRRLALDATATE